MDNGAILYTAYLNGDESALEQLVKLYYDGLVRFAYCFVKSAAVAEDVVADAYATLIVKRKRFFSRASFKTYLYKTVRNKCIDYLRFHKRFVPLDDLQNVLSTNDVDGAVEMNERLAFLYKCMQSLAPQYRYVLTLVYIEGFSVDEASRIMGKKAKQTYNLLARAKQTLKKLLIDKGINYEDL